MPFLLSELSQEHFFLSRRCGASSVVGEDSGCRFSGCVFGILVPRFGSLVLTLVHRPKGPDVHYFYDVMKNFKRDRCKLTRGRMFVHFL